MECGNIEAQSFNLALSALPTSKSFWMMGLFIPFMMGLFIPLPPSVRRECGRSQRISASTAQQQLQARIRIENA
jgi:Na+-transporting NADH:ubiquinone oxidoreductase subunit NqrB